MRGIRVLVVAIFFALVMVGCAAAPPAPPPPAPAVAILPVWDPPGRSAVTGLFAFDDWIRPVRDAVGTTLDDAVRARLDAQGVRVTTAATPGGYPPVTLRDAVAVAAGSDDGPLLYLRVVLWEANDPTAPEFVRADVDATLLEAGSGRVLWSARGPGGPITTRGATSLAEGYRRAADAVAEWLVGTWRAPA